MLGEKIINLLGIKYPIIQAGFFGISTPNLVAKISEEGALGVIGVGLRDAKWLVNEIEKVKGLTKNPFGVELFLANRNIPELIKVIINQRVPVVLTDGGNPLPLLGYFQAAGIKVICIVPSPRLAKKMEENGADVVVVKGFESGGYIGPNTTFSLVSYTKSLLKEIPLIASGGIYDSKTAAAAFLMGADGLRVMTPFLASEEAEIPQAFKQKILEADCEKIEIIFSFTPFPLRVIKNDFSQEMKRLEEKNVFPEEIDFEKIFEKLNNLEDVNSIPLFAGLSASGISEIKSCKEIIRELYDLAKEEIKKFSQNL